MTEHRLASRTQGITIARVAGGPRLWSAFVPLILFGILLTVHAVVIAQSMLVQRLWEDEAFNLTVPINLVAGLGYSSDGTLTGSTLTPFDERISTGPVVLLPIAALIAIGVEPVFAGRLIAALFWVALISGLWVIGRRISGAWGGLVAAAVPLALNTFQGNSPIQGPADVLGEVASAALIVWALWLMLRRPGWAGLALGLAIQAKFIALLAVPALAVGLLVATARPPRTWVRTLWLPALATAVPTALYELAALISLGWQGFVAQTKLFVTFLLSSGQQVEPTTVWQKIDYLAHSWFVPAPWFWLVTIIGLVGVAVVGVWVMRPATASRTPPARFSRQELTAVTVAALVGGTTFVLWWATATHTPLWIRHPASGLLAFTPVLAAVAVLGIKYLGDQRLSRQPASVFGRVVAVSAAVSLAVVLVAQLTMHTQQTLRPRAETLAQQRVDAASLRDSAHAHTWIAAHPWGAPVSIILLTGKHIGLSDAPAMVHTPVVQREACDTDEQTLAASENYYLCQRN